MPNKQPKEPTAYDRLRRALLDAHAVHLDTIKQNDRAELQLWSLRGGRLRVVQHWTDSGGWDGYKPIKASKTEEAIAELMAE